MQDTDLFLSLAEIAGVFVGFGALISVRSGGAGDGQQVAYVRAMVSVATWVAVAALTPMTLSSYGLAGHELWLMSSALAFVLILAVWAANYRTPEMQRVMARPRAEYVPEAVTNLALLAGTLVALVLVVLGPLPDQEPALYLTAVQLGLLITALALLFLVFSQRRPEMPSTREAMAAAADGTSS